MANVGLSCSMDKVELGSAIAGNIALIVGLLVPEIFKKKRKGVPLLQILTMAAYLMSAWYGLPWVSKDNMLLCMNVSCCIIEGCYIIESLRGQSKKLLCKIIGAWCFSIAVVITLACISMARYKGERRATFCAWASGASILIVNLFPIKDMSNNFPSRFNLLRVFLVQIARKSKSLKDMPLHASIFGLLSAIPWVVYGMRKKDLSTSVPNFIGIFVSGIQIWWHIRSCRMKNVRVQEQPAIEMPPLELDEWQPPMVTMDAKLVLTDYINDMKSWTPGRLANEEFLRFLRLNHGLIITAGLPMDLFDMAVKEISSLGKKKVEASLIETELDVHRAISSYLKDNQDSVREKMHSLKERVKMDSKKLEKLEEKRQEVINEIKELENDIQTKGESVKDLSTEFNKLQSQIGIYNQKIARFSRDLRNFTYWMETEVKEHDEAGNDSDFLRRKTEYKASLNSTIQQLLGDLVDIISHRE